MKRLVYFGFALAGLCALFAGRIVVKSYLEERADFIRTPSTELSRHPERTGIADLREVSFSAPGGPTIAAWYAPPRNSAAIVLVHGTGADRSHMVREGKILADAGYGIVALDLPGQGRSGGRSFWGVPEREAVSAAVTWLSDRPEVDRRRIGGLGMSMGGYILAQTSARDTRIRAVILESSPSDVVEQNRLVVNRWGPLSLAPTNRALHDAGMPLDMRPIDVVGMISPRPLFIIQGELDPVVPASMGKALFAAAREPKEFWLVPGAHHVDYANVDMEGYRSHLINFFARTLLGPAPPASVP